MLQSTYQVKQGLSALCGQMQAAQGFAAHLALPEQQGAATAATQDLLGGPERIDMSGAAYPE